MTDFYTMQKTQKGQFICSKLNEHMEVDSYYVLSRNGKSLHCNCPNKANWCKHMDLLYEFEKADALGTGRFLTSDGNWLPAIELV